MSEETKTYLPHKKFTTFQYAIHITRRAVIKVQNALAHDANPDVVSLINDEYYDFQSFIGETCGDKATRWLDHEDLLLEACRDGGFKEHEPHGLLDEALLMSNDSPRKLDGRTNAWNLLVHGTDVALYKWIESLMNYADSCYGDPKFMPTTFDASLDEYSDVRKLLEGNMGLKATLAPEWYRRDDKSYIYLVDDSRGEEYGEWWIAPLPNQMCHDGEKQIAVSKFFNDGKHFNMQVPFGDFYTFFHEVIQ